MRKNVSVASPESGRLDRRHVLRLLGAGAGAVVLPSAGRAQGRAAPPPWVAGSQGRATLNFRLTLRIDFAQRNRILQATGQQPSTYDRALSFVRGDLHAANVQDVVEWTPTSYRIVSSMQPTTMVGLAVGSRPYVRESSGVRAATGLSVRRYREKRGDGSAYLAVLDPAARAIAFSRDDKPTLRLGHVGELQDALTLVHGAWLGAPWAATRGVAVVDGKGRKDFRLARADAWDFPLGGSKVRTIRHQRQLAARDDASFEVWVSERDGLPLRYLIGLNQSYGASLQFDLIDWPGR
jgi:hypothetical protein